MLSSTYSESLSNSTAPFSSSIGSSVRKFRAYKVHFTHQVSFRRNFFVLSKSFAISGPLHLSWVAPPLSRGPRNSDPAILDCPFWSSPFLFYPTISSRMQHQLNEGSADTIVENEAPPTPPPLLSVVRARGRGSHIRRTQLQVDSEELLRLPS
jgi:hypothetical protein